MTITQTVDIPADRRLIIDVPKEIPAGRTILTFTPAPETSLHECPLCAQYRDPKSGALRPNAETIAAIEEGDAMLRGEIPAKWYNSLEEMIVDLDADD
ncbi:MAG: hypothetical protein FWH19_01605 [Treponema sp.]|nr:hypothetical protein [Treponema sp.]